MKISKSFAKGVLILTFIAIVLNLAVLPFFYHYSLGLFLGACAAVLFFLYIRKSGWKKTILVVLLLLVIGLGWFFYPNQPSVWLDFDTASTSVVKGKMGHEGIIEGESVWGRHNSEPAFAFVQNNITIDYDCTAGSFTEMAYIYPYGNSSGWISESGGKGLYLSNDKAGYRLRYENGTELNFLTGLENEWHHLAIVFDDINNELKLYVDGWLKEETKLKNTPDCKNRIYLGAGNASFMLDDYRFYKQALDWKRINPLLK